MHQNRKNGVGICKINSKITINKLISHSHQLNSFKLVSLASSHEKYGKVLATRRCRTQKIYYTYSLSLKS
jgi:hypothetical protein